jgi:predicted nucleotidyltransferase component of viral defense system
LLAEYYSNILYPLQDKAIPSFRDSPFYLTGGTALSRGYYNHRYSDDLDYFVNYHSDFQGISELIVEKLLKTFHDVEVDLKGEHFYRVFVGQEKLKIELVNDVPSHIGTLISHPSLGIIDSKENILANKLTAVVDRALPKDMVDLYFNEFINHEPKSFKPIIDRVMKL